MKVKFIDYCNTREILYEKEDIDYISALYHPHTQIQIKVKDAIYHCSYEFNVIKVNTDEVEMYVNVDEIERIKED